MERFGSVTTLLLNGRPFPSSLLGNLSYSPIVLLDGRQVIPAHWLLVTGSTTVAQGRGAQIEFTPLEGQSHSLHVSAVNPEGYLEDVVYTFNVLLRGSGVIEVGVNWNKGLFRIGETLQGRAYVADPEGQPPQSLAWTLYRNNVPVASGQTADISYPNVIDGVYRAKVTAYDARNVQLVGESTTAVTLNYELQSALLPAPPDDSCIYIGAIYGDTIEGPGGTATSLPYALASYTQEAWLLPGTTHITFDLDPVSAQVDDEVVVRTLTGNWAVRSYPTGLYNEEVGYDYQPSPMLPAPADIKLRFTVEAFNVHGLSYTPFQFRVRIKCYRQTQTIYRYGSCAYAIHPGGSGQRERKWAVLFSDLDVQVDADTDYSRYQSGTAVLTYTTPIVTSLPGLALNPTGAPIPVDASTGLVFTEANRYAIYGSDGYPDLDAKAVAAAEDVRPFLFSLEMPATPPLIQRIKRLGGTMGVYLSSGVVDAGAVVTVRVLTSLTEVVHTLAVTQTAYANTTEDFVLVGTIPIADITDFQFDHNGVVVKVSVDETTVVQSGTQPEALPAWGPSQIYAGTYAPTVQFDGACYSSPERVPVYDGQSIVKVVPLSGGCENTVCGPVAVYCYSAVCSPFGALHAIQPYHAPAPYVALPSAPHRCYGSPVFVVAGTAYVDAFAGTVVLKDQEIISYRDSSLCGDGQIYVPCNGGSNVLVVYPCDTVPHGFVEYGSQCYAYVSTQPVNNQVPALNFTNFDNWTVQGAVDLIGSCPVNTLYDLVPGHGQYVDMVGSPGTGTLVSKSVWALGAGTYAFSADIAGNQRTTGVFSVGMAVGAHGTAFYETGSTMPFTRFEQVVVLAGSETAQLRIWQQDVTPWDGIINAGNLVDNIVFEQVSPVATIYLSDSFDFFEPIPYATTISVNSTNPVLDCSDVACTRADGTGDSYVYHDVETGSAVFVRFDRLDLGVPAFGVAVTTADAGMSGLSEGSATLRFDRARKLVLTVSGQGALKLNVGLAGMPKKLVLVRDGTEQSHALGTNQSSKVLDVQSGDQVYLDVGTPFGGISKRIVGKSVRVSWVPKVTLPRLYYAADYSIKSGVVQALGFCGQTNRSDYVVYDTLPVDASTSDVVNPDSIVTVHGALEPEYVLVRNRAAGEVSPPLPSGLAWYGGQSLTAPMTFRFYAAREWFGANGEMDVWLDSDSPFPAYLKVSPYRVLFSGTDSYRASASAGDTHRNSLRVVSSPRNLYLPSVYTAGDGQRLTIHSQAGTVLVEDKSFIRGRTDPGISYSIVESQTSEWFAAFSDFHGRASNPSGLLVHALVSGWNPDYVVSIGDLLNSTPAGLTPATIDTYVGQYWNNFTFYTAIGNHDRESVAGLATFKAYYGLTDDSYDFVQGDIHWFVLDSGYDNNQFNVYSGKYAAAETDGETQTTAQALWLQAGLAASRSKFNIVVVHHPAYSSCVSVYFASQYLQYSALRWPLKAWGADLVLNGHAHLYERIVDASGLTYVTLGLGGQTPRASFKSPPTPDATSLVRANSNWGALRGRTTATTLELEMYYVDGTLVDQFSIAAPFAAAPYGGFYVNANDESIYSLRV